MVSANISFNDTLIIAPTFHRYEKYCDALVELIDKNWPDHPELYFLSDDISKKKVKYQKIIRSKNSHWPHVVLNGCIEIKRKYPAVNTVLLLNEEAFPLQEIDSHRLTNIMNILHNQSYKYVYFPCYNNLWNYSINMEGERFCRTPKNYLYYTQLGPAFWDINYLISTCSYAISMNILSPWKFELIVTGEDHLISEYRWPTVADGLFKDGFVNQNALKMFTDKKLVIRKQLKWTLLKSRPTLFYRWCLRKIIGGANRICNFVGLSPLVYPYRS